MKKFGLAVAAAASVAVTGCATSPQYGYDPYYNNGYQNPNAANTVAGAAVGAATGAIAGAVLPGIRPGVGAAVGAVLGGVLASRINGRQYYRDPRGYCYYVDQYGQPHYNYQVRC